MTPRRVKAGHDQKVRRFVRSMSREERMLVVLKRDLYEGNWSDMIADLQARLEGKPYIFKLANRISDDLERIERLNDYEKKNDVDLSDLVEIET